MASIVPKRKRNPPAAVGKVGPIGKWLGQHLQIAREQHKVSLRDFAKFLGMKSYGGIHLTEAGKVNTPIDEIAAMFDALGVTLNVQLQSGNTVRATIRGSDLDELGRAKTDQLPPEIVHAHIR
jgi:hypothetical protein